MNSKQLKRRLPHKVREAWEKNEEELAKERSNKNRSFLLGYKMAINEMFGWLEQDK